jgi:polysaccharide export outer membrane protein
MPRIYQWLAALLFCAVLATPFVQARAQAAAQDQAPATVSQDPTDNDYRLGAGDKVRVIVFGEQELTGEFFVGGSGEVSLPLVGDVHAAGLTVSQLQNAITEALKQGFLKDPKVSLEVLTFRPFYILGEVSKPGEYPYTHGLTVLNAVATAGGFTYRANTREVSIRRANEVAEHKETLTTTTKVAPGDTIRISERFF